MYRYKTLSNIKFSIDDVIADCVVTDNVHYPIFILLKVCSAFIDICQSYFETKGL